MTPSFFGSGSRRLFGMYEPADAGTAGRRAAVLCNPWGSEYIYAHRALRHLANQLCAAGFHTLRFDYFGTGDSAGDMMDGDIPGWEADIETAMEELQDLSGVARVALAGLRLGATMAAQVAARRTDAVDRLVMWSPILSGTHFADDLASDTAVPARSTGSEPAAGDTMMVHGFPLTAAVRAQLQALDLASLLAAPAMPSLLLMSEGKALSALMPPPPDSRLEVVRIDHQTPWIEEAGHSGALPVSTTQKIVSWLS